jgi:hypothetical protein
MKKSRGYHPFNDKLPQMFARSANVAGGNVLCGSRSFWLSLPQLLQVEVVVVQLCRELKTGIAVKLYLMLFFIPIAEK